MKVGKRKGLFVEFVAVLKTHEIQLMNQLDQILDGAFSTEQVGKWMNDLLLRDANKPVYGRRFGDLYDVEEQWDRISIYRLKRDGTHASLLFRACLSGLEKVSKNERVMSRKSGDMSVKDLLRLAKEKGLTKEETKKLLVDQGVIIKKNIQQIG